MSIRNMLYPAGGRPKSAVSEFHVQIRDKLEVALRYVYQAPIMPVVSRADCRKLEGVISSEAVLDKYRVVPREELAGPGGRS